MSFFTELLAGLRSLFTWYFAVAPWERAVRVRWGKHDELLQPGLHWRIPLRDRVYRQSVRLRSTETHGQNVTTKDGQLVTISCVVEWAIGDLLQVFRTITQPERTLATRVKALVAAHVNATPSNQLSPGQVSEAITTQFRAMDWGLTNVSVKVTEFVSIARTYRLIQGGHGYIELDHDMRWQDDMFTATARNLK